MRRPASPPSKLLNHNCLAAAALDEPHHWGMLQVGSSLTYPAWPRSPPLSPPELCLSSPLISYCPARGDKRCKLAQAVEGRMVARLLHQGINCLGA